MLAVVLLACAAIGFLSFFVSFALGGILYVVGFMALTWLRPELALLIIFAAAPFVWDVGGGPVKMAVSELSLVLAFPVLLLKALAAGKPFAVNPMRWPVIGYFLVCLASTLINGSIESSATSILQMVVYLCVAVFTFSSLITSKAEVMPALYGLLASETFLALLLVVTRDNYVLGLHKNAIGTQLGSGVVVAAELWLAGNQTRRTRIVLGGMLGILAMGLVFSLSRGAWVGTAAALTIILLLRRQFGLAFKAILLLLPLVAVAWFLLPESSREYATNVSGSAYNINARYKSVDYAMTFFRANPVIGAGVGLRKTYDATNLIMSTLAETGVLGLVTFLAIFVVFFGAVWKAQKTLPRTDPAFSFLAIGAGLVASKFLHGCVDHYWSRGILPVWASVGMAIFAYNVARRFRVKGGMT